MSPERFDARVAPEPMSGCWIWTGNRSTLGYGVIGNNPRVYAHRVAYERWVGSIPDDRELDHRCRLTSCVNPAHLRAVSHQENIRRATFPQSLRTHCPRGHPYSEANTYRNPRRRGRWCRACHNARSGPAQIAYRRRKRERARG